MATEFNTQVSDDDLALLDQMVGLANQPDIRSETQFEATRENMFQEIVMVALDQARHDLERTENMRLSEVKYLLITETAEKLIRLKGVEDVLAGIVAYMDGRLNDDGPLALFEQLTRRVELQGGEVEQHGQRIWSRPGEGE